MIRSLPLTPITLPLAFTAPTPPRREVPREIDPNEPPGQDAFTRMLGRQREQARRATRRREAAQASASEAASTTKDAGAAGQAEPAAPAESVRAASRSAVRQAGDADKPAQIDPESPASEARHGRATKNPGSEAELLARLFKTPPKGLPPKQAPIGPEGPEGTGGPDVPPEADPAAPGTAKVKPVPPDVECPVDPTMLAQAPAPAAAARSDISTQALQARDAGDAAGATGNVGVLTGADRGVDADAGAGTGTGTGTGGGTETGTGNGGAAAWADGAAASGVLAATPAGSAPVDAGPATGTTDLGANPGTPLTAAMTAAITAAPPAAPAGAPAPRHATLDPHPGTEAFQMKFSAQVAVWVREGVHEAQLQLNPADMGPVRVAILLEGAAAQINFSAEHALTRQALEQALPSLAGSLAEAGFTLAGGGVFDQPRQPERSAGDDARRSADTRASAAGSDADAPARSAIARPRGVVDLVA